MFSTPSIKATSPEPSGDQLHFPIAHLLIRDAIFLCTWCPAELGHDESSGAFLCSKDELMRFLLTPNFARLVALQVLAPSGPFSWSLRPALTLARYFTDDRDIGELVFGDDVELFNSWSERLPSSVTLTPLWSAPSVELRADATNGVL